MGQCVQALMMMTMRVMKMEGDGVGGAPGCCAGEDCQS